MKNRLSRMTDAQLEAHFLSALAALDRGPAATGQRKIVLDTAREIARCDTQDPSFDGVHTSLRELLLDQRRNARELGLFARAVGLTQVLVLLRHA